jgi:hypothetical protein
MLRKLLKYEIKATARIFLPLYLVLVAFGFINRIFLSPDEFGAPSMITMMLYILILVGTFVMTFIVMIQRFYKNLLNDEGYLMFTLPAETWKHIMSKLLVSMMWNVLSVIFAAISVLIIATKSVSVSEILSGIRTLFDRLTLDLGASSYLFIVQFALSAVMGLITGILMIYASIALGHLFNRHRIMASLGAYFCLYTASQIFITAIASFLFGSRVFSAEAAPGLDIMHNILWLVISISAVLAGVYYTITDIILSRRLNLE